MSVENNNAVLEAIYSRKESQRGIANTIADRITAKGTSEGADKGWETRKSGSNAAFKLSEYAHNDTAKAASTWDRLDHGTAAYSHEKARDAHGKMTMEFRKAGEHHAESKHALKAGEHRDYALVHRKAESGKIDQRGYFDSVNQIHADQWRHRQIEMGRAAQSLAERNHQREQAANEVEATHHLESPSDIISARLRSEHQVGIAIADRITAAGTSESVKKSWVTRHLITPQAVLSKINLHDTAAYASKSPEGFAAHMASREAFSIGEKASEFTGRATHNQAQTAHLYAAHLQSGIGNKEHQETHLQHAKFHGAASAEYFRLLDEGKYPSSEKSTMGWRQANRERSIKNGSDD
jgi:hypothetical protein